MPTTKSAERRMRSSERKRLDNRRLTSRLKSLEKKYLALVTAGNKSEAATALRTVHSAFDKAAKSGVIHRVMANRKKSRLSTRLHALK